MPDEASPNAIGTRVDGAEVFRHAASLRAGTYAPLYSRLWQTIAEDTDLLAIASHARPGVSQPDLFLACVHYLLAKELDHPLARHYPSLHDRTDSSAGDPGPLLRQFCLDRRDALIELLSTRLVQTNEVRRCTFLRPAVAMASRLAGDRPIALIEPGASAGLNLGMDRYAYDYDSNARYGSPQSSLVLSCQLRGMIPAPVATGPSEIGRRVGIDLHPLDPTNQAHIEWLRACVWADHLDRLRRLDQALALASDPRNQVEVRPGDATEHLPELIDEVADDLTVVIFHCAFLAHLTADQRERFEALVPVLSTRRPILWVQAEWRPDPTEPRLRLAICVHGRIAQELALGRYHPHGEWLEWVLDGNPQPIGTPSSR